MLTTKKGEKGKERQTGRKIGETKPNKRPLPLGLGSMFVSEYRIEKGFRGGCRQVAGQAGNRRTLVIS